MKMLALAAAFAPLILLAGAALGADSPCAALDGTGCFYVPASARERGEAALLIYLRGHWQGFGDGRVSEKRRVVSSRQAFAEYGLEGVAEKEGLVVLVTGSSDAGVANEDLEALERAAGVGFSRLYLAAHSGGFVGLGKTLATVRRPDRIVMLDNFYFGRELSRAVQRAVSGGAACSGFYTRHNEVRCKERFESVVPCAVERHDDYGHNGGVNRCLAAYLRGEPCR